MKQYPPYEGNEPYLYFAFAEADKARVWKIMRPLLERGCRVWYCRGPAGSADKVLQRQERSGRAELTVLYLSDAACEDQDTKSYILVNQKNKRPIICLDPDRTDRRLSMGLHESVPHIPLYGKGSGADIESAITHADGFSQEMLGEPVITDGGGILSRLTALFAILTLVVLLITLAGIRYMPGLRPEPEDEVTIQDPVILDAVREEAGGGVITEEFVREMTGLHLETLPGNWDDLSLFPSLERLIIPQQCLAGDGELPEGDYIIELTGGSGG